MRCGGGPSPRRHCPRVMTSTPFTCGNNLGIFFALLAGYQTENNTNHTSHFFSQSIVIRDVSRRELCLVFVALQGNFQPMLKQHYRRSNCTASNSTASWRHHYHFVVRSKLDGRLINAHLFSGLSYKIAHRP